MINDCNNIPRHPWQHAYDMMSWLYAHLAMQKIHDTLAFPEIVFGQAHLSIFSVTELCKSDSHQHHSLLPVLVYVCYLFHLHFCCIAEIMILPLANPIVSLIIA